MIAATRSAFSRRHVARRLLGHVRQLRRQGGGQASGRATDHAAATVTTASATAWYGLHNLARVSSRDKVLIHSATGGVGQAAIAMARAAGAKIFATAGSEDRRNLLRDMGIEHVYDSRSIDFADQIRKDTGGYGVDISSTPCPAPRSVSASNCWAVGGRFVEIGKRDIYDNTPT